MLCYYAHMGYLIPEENRAVAQYFRQALSCPPGKAVAELKIHEFQHCRYLLQHQKGPAQLAFLSCASPQALPAQAGIAVTEAYKGFAQLMEPEIGYQLTVKVCTKFCQHQREQEQSDKPQRSTPCKPVCTHQVHVRFVCSINQCYPVMQLCS